ncbi:phosphoribosylformylglycinamidine synthase, partial [Streptococcus pluranimalium]
MAKRIFVEKKANFQIKAEVLLKELVHNLQLNSLSSLRLVQVYDVFGLEEDLFEQAVKHIFTEQVTDKVLTEQDLALDQAVSFAIEALPGQFDQRAASAQEALLLLGSRQDVRVNTGQLYILNVDVTEADLAAIKKYLLNPVDSRFKDMD